MKKKFFMVAAVIFSNYIYAQTDTTVKELNEVVITANKFEQKQNSTGKTITIISKEQIEKSVGKSVAQLLNEQAGITIPGSLNALGNVQSVMMRGASAGRTLILIDGVPVFNPARNENDFDLNLLSLSSIQRIEICRGAQSTLYGSDAAAGVINIITTSNQNNKKLGGAVTISAGNKSNYNGSINLFGNLGGFSYSVNYAKRFIKGFSNAYDSTKANLFDEDKYDADVVSSNIKYKFTNNLSVKAFVQYSKFNAGTDAGAFVDDRDYITNSKSILTGAGFHFKNEAVSVTGNFQCGDSKFGFVNDSTHVSGFASYEKSDFNSNTKFVELYANVKLLPQLSLLHGADYRYGSMNSNYHSESMFGAFDSPFKDTAVNQSSMYSSLLYNDKKFNAEAGGRLNVHSKYGFNYTYTFASSYNFNEQWRLFANLSSGFKAPSLYQLFDAYSGTETLKPEKSKSFEVGFQYNNKKITNRLLYFNRNSKDGIDFDYVNYKFFNFVQQTAWGIEYEAKFNLLKEITVSANYTYLHANEKNQSRLTTKDTTYTYLLRRPAHSINAAISYSHKKIYANLQAKYVSSRYDVGGYAVDDEKLPSYLIINAYAEYEVVAKLKVFANAQNLTNKKFFDIRGYNSIPLLVSFGVTFKW